MEARNTFRDRFVASDGDDGHPGTSAQPWRTLGHAATQLEPGDRCLIRGGVYRELVRVTRGGEPGQPVRFEAVPGEHVVLTGTDPVQTAWVPHEGAIQASPVDTVFEQLFAGTQKLPEARWPHASSDQMLERDRWAAADSTGHGWVEDEALAATGVDAHGATAWLSVAHQFYAWSRRVNEHQPGAPLFRYTADLRGLAAWERRAEWPQPTGDQAPRYVLVGSLSLLDQPGQWFLDRSTMTLYLWPPNDAEPADLNLGAAVRPLAFDVVADHMELVGLTFIATTFRFAADWGRVEDCRLRYPTCRRDFPDPGPPGGDGEVITATRLVGDHHVVRGCTLAHSSMAGLEVLGSESLIEDCLVEDVCWSSSLQYSGIRLGPRPGDPAPRGRSIVRRCTVRDGGNALVHVGNIPDNVVEYCHIHDGGRLCKDVSLLYTQLPTINGTVFRHNWVHTCHAPHIALGIRGDDQTRSLTIHHNVVWDCGWGGIVVKGDDNHVHHNTCFSNGTEHGYGDIRLDSMPEPEKPWRQQWPLLERQNAHSEACCNLAVIKGGRPGFGTPDAPGGRLSHNIAGGLEHLANPAQLDFRPAAGSPLIGAGYALPGITGPYSGEAPDVGAYQHNAEPWVPGCPDRVLTRGTEADAALKAAMPSAR